MLDRRNDQIGRRFVVEFYLKLFVCLNANCCCSLLTAKAKWRKFCNDMEQSVEDFNYATLMRLNARQDYNEENTIVVPRAQFIAIEIARNRLGFNDNLPSPSE